MARRYLVVSDLHLCDVEEHADGWKSYKRQRYLIDNAFAELLSRFTEQAAQGDDLFLLLNGDTFDFDLVSAVPERAPWRTRLLERRSGLHATAQKSAWKLSYMLHFHLGFLEALARFLSAGHTVVYIMGNHDREFHFREVQAVFLHSLQSRAGQAGLSFPRHLLRFEPWFFYVPDEIYAEHGQQYDYYTSFRYLLDPVVHIRGEEHIALPMGNISNRYLLGKMGTFNPYASDYIMNLYAYVSHWLRHYALTRRSILIPYITGTVLVMKQMLDFRRRLLRPPPGYRQRIYRVGERVGLSEGLMLWLARRQRAPITEHFFRVVREFWVDRIAISLFMLLGTAVLALVPIPLWVKIMVPASAFPLAFFIYESLARGDDIFTIERRFPEVARDIARTLGVKVVTFGHTHVPRQIPLQKNVDFVDTGTWAPIMDPAHPDELAGGYRNYLLLVFHEGGHQLTFHSLLDGPCGQGGDCGNLR